MGRKCATKIKVTKSMGRKCAMKIKVTHAPMIKFVEDAIRNFNIMQLEEGTGRRESIKSMFEKLGQSLWFSGSGDSFVAHLDKMKENAHHKREVENNAQN